MKKEVLIEKLRKMPDDIEICIFDWRKNMNEIEDDGSSGGIYSDFNIELFDDDMIKENTKSFIALTILNDDYDIGGNLIKEH